MSKHALVPGLWLSLGVLFGCTPGNNGSMMGGGDLASPVSDLADADAGSFRGLGDNFEGAQLTGWNDLFPTLHSTLSVTGGQLRMAPLSVTHTHWYADDHGPMIYKNVTGNFIVEIDVQVGRATDITQAPRGAYSAGGIVVRDPASSAPGNERWLMYNVGYQATAVAREAKTTRPGSPGSVSTLYLIPSGGVLSGKLRVCRQGGLFRFFHQLAGEPVFIEEAYENGTTPMGNGAGQATPGVTVGGVIAFDRPDLPSTVQVGLIAGNYDPPYEVRADFNHVRFGPLGADRDCTVPLPQ